MSLREVKEEFKQTEGDPLVKGKIRQLRMERSRKRMMAAVPAGDSRRDQPDPLCSCAEI